VAVGALPLTPANQAQRTTARRGRPLLDLQQRFVDLRFGMFLHFNMTREPGQWWAAMQEVFHLD
jgi:alpha-L-fucosidase